MNSYFFARWWCKQIYLNLWSFFRLHSLKYHKSWVAKIFWVYQLNINLVFLNINWIFFKKLNFYSVWEIRFWVLPLGRLQIEVEMRIFHKKLHHPVVSAICLSKPIQGILVPKLTIGPLLKLMLEMGQVLVFELISPAIRVQISSL